MDIDVRELESRLRSKWWVNGKGYPKPLLMRVYNDYTIKIHLNEKRWNKGVIDHIAVAFWNKRVSAGEYAIVYKEFGKTSTIDEIIDWIDRINSDVFGYQKLLEHSVRLEQYKADVEDIVSDAMKLDTDYRGEVLVNAKGLYRSVQRAYEDITKQIQNFGTGVDNEPR